LTPLGQYRKKYIHPSRGKRKNSKKRKREECNKLSARDDEQATRAIIDYSRTASIPPAPEISGYIDVGLTTVTRTLQHLSSPDSAAPPSGDKAKINNGSGCNVSTPTTDKRPAAEEMASPSTSSSGSSGSSYTAIFIARSGQTKPFQAHFPQMVAAASKTQGHIRLVGFLKQGVAERLSAALDIPRVSVVGLRVGAPNANPLVEFLSERVDPVVVPWLEGKGHDFRKTQIKAVETVRCAPRPRRRE